MASRRDREAWELRLKIIRFWVINIGNYKKKALLDFRLLLLRTISQPCGAELVST